MAKLRESITSNCERKFIIKSLAEYRRLDGRAFDEFRELNIEYSKDWGCCYVSLGRTRVLAQVSCEIQLPKSSRPSEGILNINVELTPMGAPHFEAGRQSELSVQLNRILEKCIKDSKAVDLESLCIKVSEKVWALRVDINVLNHEGNIVDCASVAALAALAHFRRPDITCDGEETIVHRYTERDPIPTVIHHYPVCISYAIFTEGDTILADPTLLEEEVADAKLIIGLNAYKELCGLHLGGSALMAPEDILKCTSKAASRANIVIQQIKETVERDKEAREQNKIVSFENSLQFDKDTNFPLRNLNIYLDKWSKTEQKKRNKLKKNQDENMECDNNTVKESPSGSIESLGKGSAVLMPVEDNNDNVWEVSSEEESEGDVVMSVSENECKSKIVEDITEEGDDNDQSEEDSVVILDGNGKSSSKKRKRRK